MCIHKPYDNNPALLRYKIGVKNHIEFFDYNIFIVKWLLNHIKQLPFSNISAYFGSIKVGKRECVYISNIWKYTEKIESRRVGTC